MTTGGVVRRVELLRALVDLEVVADYEGENLTWEELAKALGVEPNEAGNLDGVELFNACLGAMSNPEVRALPTEQRLRVIRSAADALGALRSGSLE